MIDSIKGLPGLPAQPAAGVKKAEGAAGSSFGELLKDSIDNVNKLQTEADKAIEGLVKGENNNVHETMMAVEKANLSFSLMLQVRNKMLAAYEEIMRMQV